MQGEVSSSLLSSETPGGNVREILGRIVSHAAQSIKDLPEKPEDSVHDIRVGMKKFRAILKIAEPSLKPAVFQKADKLARRLKDHFGSQRDDDVQRKLLLSLLDKPSARTAVDAMGLSAHHQLKRIQEDPSASGMCSSLAALVEDFPLAGMSREEILSAWVTTYRNARRAMKACRENRKDDFLFHEWRKRVKEFLYQSAMIGAPLDVFAPAADQLSSALGSHHDLAVLTQRIAEQAALAEAGEAAAAEKKNVARHALALGRKLFDEKPSILHRRFQNT